MRVPLVPANVSFCWWPLVVPHSFPPFSFSSSSLVVLHSHHSPLCWFLHWFLWAAIHSPLSNGQWWSALRILFRKRLYTLSTPCPKHCCSSVQALSSAWLPQAQACSPNAMAIPVSPVSLVEHPPPPLHFQPQESGFRGVRGGVLSIRWYTRTSVQAAWAWRSWLVASLHGMLMCKRFPALAHLRPPGKCQSLFHEFTPSVHSPVPIPQVA